MSDAEYSCLSALPSQPNDVSSPVDPLAAATRIFKIDNAILLLDSQIVRNILATKCCEPLIARVL